MGKMGRETEARSNALWGAGGRPGDSRTSALWGGGGRPGDSRGNALWGKGGRGTALLLAFVAALALPMAATGKGREEQQAKGAFVPVSLLQAAEANPDAMFDVIVQGAKGTKGSDVAESVDDVSSKGKRNGKLGKSFKNVAAASAELSGEQILELATRTKDVSAITPDHRMRASDLSFEYVSYDKWPYTTGAPVQWFTDVASVKAAPTIAIIDSGIDASRPEFGGRVIEQKVMTSLQPNSPGDGRGHGTFVAAIAAGSLKGKAGVSPASKIVSLDVMDDNGMAMTSDVIAAVDYAIQNKDRLSIKVLNMSLHATTPASIMFDPLDRAVEAAWFNGIVVVAAAGNYRTTAGASGVPYAPGNDPFIITVGAADIASQIAATDDFAAPWSAYGYTLDGFAKPDLGAPGRYMTAPVPVTSTLWAERVDARIGNSGYLRLSGTSFAAPAVAGAAALLLAEQPHLTPDQVKGALMMTAAPATAAAPLSLGVGLLQAHKAAKLTTAPNPNLALAKFVTTDPVTGLRAFDAASWSSTAASDASWASASWSSASWSSASWSSASWSSASWSSASWSSASWSSSSISDASWSSASWSSQAKADSADGDPTVGDSSVQASEADLEAFQAEHGIELDPLINAADGLTTATQSLIGG